MKIWALSPEKEVRKIVTKDQVQRERERLQAQVTIYLDAGKPEEARRISEKIEELLTLERELSQ